MCFKFFEKSSHDPWCLMYSYSFPMDSTLTVQCTFLNLHNNWKTPVFVELRFVFTLKCTSGLCSSSSVKNSLFSTPLSYMGFGGYINPFTLEAQINTNIPAIQIPTTICHEIAHQIGYSAENEANFIGILASVNSNNKLVKYSGNVLALRYLLNELYQVDKKSFDQLYLKINKGVLKNIKQAESAADILMKSYETGTMDFKDVLDIQELQLKFEMQQTEALENYYLQTTINYLTQQ